MHSKYMYILKFVIAYFVAALSILSVLHTTLSSILIKQYIDIIRTYRHLIFNFESACTRKGSTFLFIVRVICEKNLSK